MLSLSGDMLRISSQGREQVKALWGNVCFVSVTFSFPPAFPALILKRKDIEFQCLLLHFHVSCSLDKIDTCFQYFLPVTHPGKNMVKYCCRNGSCCLHLGEHHKGRVGFYCWPQILSQNQWCFQRPVSLPLSHVCEGFTLKSSLKKDWCSALKHAVFVLTCVSSRALACIKATENWLITQTSF